MKVYLETMGCQMNVLDSELVSSLLGSAGMELTDDAREADVLLYNTCSVREHAEQKVRSRLGWACRRKADGKKTIIGVLGCMAQRLGEGLCRQHAGVDIVCGPGRLADLVEMIRAASDGTGTEGASPRRPQVALDAPRGKARPAPLDDALECLRDPKRTHLPAQAYVRVMHGCDRFCSYCVVPYVRGPERCRRPEAIIEEVRRLAGAGATQVTLLGQAISAYRWHDGGKTFALADILERLDGIAGLRRVRFITSHPAGFDAAILGAMRDSATVCPYLHVPAQSGSDRVLRAMNRGYTRGEYDALIDRARETVPGLAPAGDFIVGFPGESEEDFAASVDLLRRCRYKNSFIFRYSARPGTVAARRWSDDVPEQVKRRRNAELLAAQEEVSLADNRDKVAQTLEVLVEGPSPRSGSPANRPARADQVQLVGRTRTDHIVVFDGPGKIAGEYVQVAITGATALALFGRMV